MFETLIPKNEPEPNPNAETIKAIKEALSRKGLKAEDIDDLFNQLGN